MWVLLSLIYPHTLNLIFCLSSSESKEEYINFSVQSNVIGTDDLGEVAAASKDVGDANTESEVTVRYLDENQGSCLDFNPITDNSFYNDYTAGTDLNSFLTRPVLINTITLTEASNSNTVFNPWNQYFTTTAISKKLDNYSLLSCNLKLKFIINASPFYYGQIICSYRPLSGYNTDNIINVSTYADDLVPLSQRPHIYLYPQTCQGGEMTLPFFYFKNWLRVNKASDFTDMGAMTVRTIVPLTNANGLSSQTVTLQIFCWAEDVRVAGPTVALSLQSSTIHANHSIDDFDDVVWIKRFKKNISDKEDRYLHDLFSKITSMNKSERNELNKALAKILYNRKKGFIVQSRDEYGMGSISKPASAIAAAAKQLSRIPIIGPYATTTSMIASAVGKAAGALGYTNVPVIDDVKPLQPTVFGPFSSAEIGTPVNKLTFDPKNELSIDNRIVGLPPTDDMIISTFVQRESYLNQFTWSHSTAVDSLICAFAVQPEMIVSSTPVSYAYRNAPPMAHIQQMFHYWRGDIIYRFRFICSKFHRGRARITWDPEGDIITNTQTSPVAFTQIVDISTNCDIEVRVPYMQSAAWQNCQTSVVTPYYGGSGYTYSRQPTFDNGTLAVKVFTVQTSPVASADITVVVSVRGAENLEFNGPKEVPQLLTPFAIQSTFTYEEPVQVIAGNNINSFDENRYLINHGEAITSLRTLLRRTSFVCYIGSPTTDSTNAGRRPNVTLPRFPPTAGFDPNGWHSAKGLVVTGSNFPFNYVLPTPYTWLQFCFVGRRGSSIWHANISATTPISSVRARRGYDTLTTGFYNVDTYATTADFNAIAAFATVSVNSRPGAGGSAFTNQTTQAGLSVYLPMYNTLRMIDSDPNTTVLGAAKPQTQDDSWTLNYLLKPAASNSAQTNTSIIELYFAVGTDFNFIFFLNVPTLASMSAWPTAN